jgi:hypothetical protein
MSTKEQRTEEEVKTEANLVEGFTPKMETSIWYN